MARVRRTRYLLFTCQDGPVLDVAALLRGVGRLAPARTTYALSILRGEEYPVAPDELEWLLSIPSDADVETNGADAAMADRLARLGLVVTDDPDEELAELARRDRALEDGQWNLYGALYHFLTKWRDVDLGVGLDEEADAGELPPAVIGALDEILARRGAPPPAFHTLAEPRARHELPVVERDDGLYAALAQRRTTRGFDRDARMTTEELAVVLHYVFGCHGTAPMGRGELMIKRTSPSGGGLHPIDAYPLVIGVDGVEPGLYHYDAREHALELIAALDVARAHETANAFVCGQRFLASAQVLFVMAARFYRSFWKYRRHQKAYAALVMDAAHLSQTLYLVAAELGLGAFVTVAVNGANIEERLGLDGFEQGVVAVSGCGRRAAVRPAIEPEFTAYVPRRTPLPDDGGAGAP